MMGAKGLKRASEAAHGNTDGRRMFEGLVEKVLA